MRKLHARRVAAAALIEKLGITTASIIGSGFLKQAEVVGLGLGVPLAIAPYPGHPLVDSIDELKKDREWLKTLNQSTS